MIQLWHKCVKRVIAIAVTHTTAYPVTYNLSKKDPGS